MGTFEEKVMRITASLSEEQLQLVAFMSFNELCCRYARRNDMMETELGLVRYQNACLKEALRKHGILDPFSRRARNEHIPTL